jgi:hypothetical protein
MASSDANYLSAQVQQVLAMVLPAPLVTILASLSDLIYRAVLGKPNECVWKPFGGEIEELAMLI